MTDDLSVSLCVIETALRRLGREALLLSMQSGLSAGAVRTMLDSVDLPSAPDVEAVYGWCDATAPDGLASLDDIQLFPAFTCCRWTTR